MSCAGLDRITIKGSKSREPLPFAANRMSKCFSPRSPLEVLVKTAKWCCASLEDPKTRLHFIDSSGLMTRKMKTMTQLSARWRKCRKWSESEECVAPVMLLGLFNESRVFSTIGQAVEMLRFNNNSLPRSSEDWKGEKVTHTHTNTHTSKCVLAVRLARSSSASGSGCMVIYNCRRDKSQRGLRTHVTGRNRCLIYCHMCWAAWRHWSRRLSRGFRLQSARGAFAVCSIAHRQIKTLIRK